MARKKRDTRLIDAAEKALLRLLRRSEPSELEPEDPNYTPPLSIEDQIEVVKVATKLAEIRAKVIPHDDSDSDASFADIGRRLLEGGSGSGTSEGQTPGRGGAAKRRRKRGAADAGTAPAQANSGDHGTSFEASAGSGADAPTSQSSTDA